MTPRQTISCASVPTKMRADRLKVVSPGSTNGIQDHHHPTYRCPSTARPSSEVGGGACFKHTEQARSSLFCGELQLVKALLKRARRGSKRRSARPPPSSQHSALHRPTHRTHSAPKLSSGVRDCTSKRLSRRESRACTSKGLPRRKPCQKSSGGDPSESQWWLP